MPEVNISDSELTCCNETSGNWVVDVKVLNVRRRHFHLV